METLQATNIPQKEFRLQKTRNGKISHLKYLCSVQHPAVYLSIAT